MGFRFVRPDRAVLQLSDGKTVTVRRRLTTGEERTHLRRCLDQNGNISGIDIGFYTVVAYLLDWSSPDATDDNPLPPIAGVDEATLMAAIDCLDPDDFIEIKQAIEAHVAALVKARADAKKKTAGTTPSAAPTLSSPSVAVGELIGSAT